MLDFCNGAMRLVAVLLACLKRICRQATTFAAGGTEKMEKNVMS